MEIETLLALVIGFYCGYKVSEWIQLWMLKQILKDLGISTEQLAALHKNLAEQLGSDPVPENSDDDYAALPKVAITIEQVGDTLYAYRKDNGRFIGQANTAEDLIRRMGETVQDVKLTVAQEDGGQLIGGTNWEYDTVDKAIIRKE